MLWVQLPKAELRKDDGKVGSPGYVTSLQEEHTDKARICLLGPSPSSQSPRIKLMIQAHNEPSLVADAASEQAVSEQKVAFRRSRPLSAEADVQADEEGLEESQDSRSPSGVLL